ncbi:3-deoxy-D-manno-octulosonic acid transferase [Cytophaga aurantiaca]|uniref:3-deoxy-D-manno-octulosonic acid transferase n=1 Tax=Cytophaga aurantiaca TaxID=29530 RepID=UPI00037A2C5A|nr:glycosyltransferase N-terminal domain-containing protein [Cytophaga aurantiaca]
MKFIYDLSIYVYNWLIVLAKLGGNKKAAFISEGRKATFSKIESFRSSYKDPIALFHCASLGEFEQARPVIEAWKKQYPEYKIAVSFYSPSGYEVRKNYAQADLIVYLPADTKKEAQAFIHDLSPAIVFIVKYEFWLNLLDAIADKKIPLFLISGVFRKKLLFFRTGGGFMRKRLHAFSHFFLQDRNSGELLTSIGFKNWSVSGDTRFDRVQQTARAAKQLTEIETFKQQKPLLVIGSGWQADMNVLIPFINAFDQELKIIFAPHEIHSKEIEEVTKQLTKKSILYSGFNKEQAADADILVIDNIGMLSSIYAYADYAYVGGAFGSGLHNILEPAVFGSPIFFGPKIKKFPEAAWLIKLGYAKSITSTETFTKEFNTIYESITLQNSIRSGLKSTMLQACGATDHIMNTLSKDSTLNFNTPTR